MFFTDGHVGSEYCYVVTSTRSSVTGHYLHHIFAAPNQVTTFIKQHGGPGVQHIGLRTERLVEVVNYLRLQGLPFVQPPPEYYEEVWSLKPLKQIALDSYSWQEISAENFLLAQIP